MKAASAVHPFADTIVPSTKASVGDRSTGPAGEDDLRFAGAQRPDPFAADDSIDRDEVEPRGRW